MAHTTPEDLLVEDRGYVSYKMLVQAAHDPCQIVTRCSSASFSVARRMLKGEGENSQIAILKPCKKQRAEMKKLGLPML